MGLRDLTWFDVLRRNAALRPDGAALVVDGARITHREAAARAEALAGGLMAAGLGRGDRVGILAQNRPEIMDALGAAARLGAILVPVNWRLGAEEVAAVLVDAAPTLVIVDAESWPLLSAARDALPGATGWYVLGEAREGARSYAELAGGSPPPAEPEVAADDPLVIIHTAAVEGKARGAVLSHANLMAHNGQLGAAWRLGPEDVALAVLPLFHISGLGLAAALAQAGGASVVLRRFEAAAAAAAIEAEAVTVMCEFAPILGQILDAAGDGASLATLRAVWGLDSPETIARFEAACPGAAFWSGYGQSETSGYVSFSPHRDRPGTAGRPGALARLAILDEEDRPVAPGTVGEIAVRGPLVFRGYWNLPDETAWTFRGGWHHTGDMGRFDEEGYLVYAGRSPAKELIKTGGENVYPAEVERALREHEAVAEAMVFGVPDPRWGEAVRAVCEARPGMSVGEEALIAFVGERIARYKRPKNVRFVERLPRLADGRPDRARIRAEHGA